MTTASTGIRLWQFGQPRPSGGQPVALDPLAVARRLQRTIDFVDTNLLVQLPPVTYASGNAPYSIAAESQQAVAEDTFQVSEPSCRGQKRRIKNARLGVGRKQESTPSTPSTQVVAVTLSYEAEIRFKSEDCIPLKPFAVLCGKTRHAFPKRRTLTEIVTYASSVCAGKKAGVDEETLLFQVLCSPRRKTKFPAATRAKRCAAAADVSCTLSEVSEYSREYMLRCREAMQEELANMAGLPSTVKAEPCSPTTEPTLLAKLRYRRSRSAGPRAGPTWQVPLPVDSRASYDDDADCKGSKGGRPASLKPGKEKRASFRFQLPTSPLANAQEPVLRRELRSLLNKITPDNEYVIMARLRGVLHNEEGCETLAKLIMETAMRDPFQSEVYARTTSRLALDSSLERVNDTLSGPTHFKKCMLLECRRQYNFFFAGNLKPEHFDNEAAEDEETAEKALKLREKIQATVRFFANLFLERILGINVLEQCFTHILQLDTPLAEAEVPPQVWLECALELLETAGCKALGRTSRGKTIQTVVLNRLKGWTDMRQVEPGSTNTAYAVSTRMRFLIRNSLDAFQ
eukprot:TRINITY_DN6290_c0_g1_i1.p1 TRINITY_DN6290_c0_g1~~TRINITY_DN6290_c0_g1_i1.p1  ORF type:complete len:572 (+),score=83.46 TRINITY_DN6290_c0_g1_i1:83-1798(+)